MQFAKETNRRCRINNILKWQGKERSCDGLQIAIQEGRIYCNFRQMVVGSTPKSLAAFFLFPPVRFRTFRMYSFSARSSVQSRPPDIQLIWGIINKLAP